MILNYNSSLRKISKDLRNNQTKAEKEMWYFLKKNYPLLKFNRQLPIDNFVVDLLCKDIKLIVEVDGEIHNFQKEKDLERDNYLFHKYELKTLRFTNEEVLKKQSILEEKLDKYLASFEGGRDE